MPCEFFRVSVGGSDKTIHPKDSPTAPCDVCLATAAASQASSGKKQLACRVQVYFVNDANPINNFEHFGRIVEGLGYRYA